MSKLSSPILVVDDEAPLREIFADVLRKAGFAVLAAADGREALALIREKAPAMVVSDIRMPGMSGLDLLREARAVRDGLPFLLVTAYASVKDAVQALKLGAVDYLEKPVDLDELVAAVRDALGPEGCPEGAAGDASAEVPAELLSGVVAESAAMRAVFADAWRVARSRATVLLTGESGTGKEVLARFLHRASPRADGPFVALNCAAIPASLLASELFGHKRGAFTGAVADRGGLFREADGGTLFLDEIGDMPVELQPALLRAIETGRVTPVGGNTELASDFRLVAATNRDLREAVAQGRFREDLYYRLNVINLELPPLRLRREEILPLARHFLRRRDSAKRLSSAAARMLHEYPWPGNVRELANAMERVAVLARNELVMPEHLPPAIRSASPVVPEEGEAAESAGLRTLRENEDVAIRQALAKTGGNQTRAAQLLGISRRTLINKLKRLRFGA